MCVFDNDFSCKALTVKNCHGCGFQKTPEQLREGQAKSIKRLQEIGMLDYYDKKYGIK